MKGCNGDSLLAVRENVSRGNLEPWVQRIWQRFMRDLLDMKRKKAFERTSKTPPWRFSFNRIVLMRFG